MKFVSMDPPGAICSDEALRDLVKGLGAKTFVDLGCGGGHVSKLLCSMGMTGTGIDFSRPALAVASNQLRREIDDGRYRLVESDALDIRENLAPADLAISYMVMEHIQDDTDFVRKASDLVRPGGYMIVAVPGGKDHWWDPLESTCRHASLSIL